MIGFVHSQDLDTISSYELKNYSGFWEVLIPDSSIATWDIRLTIMDQGIYSVGQIKNKQGTLFYQADALWTYNKNINYVTMYEINSERAEMIHIGKFISVNNLYVAIYESEDDNKLIQESYLELIDNNNLKFTSKQYNESGINELVWNFKRIR